MKKLYSFPIEVQAFKRQAKEMKKKFNLSSSQAHEQLAHLHGFNSYNHYLSEKTK